MPEILVATPLWPQVVAREHSFSDGISIRELSPILWETLKPFFSDDDCSSLKEIKFWLCASREVEHGLNLENDLYEQATHAAWALQIICPSGSKHVFLKFQKTPRGYDNIGIHRPKELCRTLVSRLTCLEGPELEEHFDRVYAGVRKTFAEKIVRLQNPILLLEHGMQIGNVYLGTLMFVMAMDMLFMAGDIRSFIPRVSGFLGADSLIFPATAIMNRQPSTRVRELVRDLYKLRNIIAHGQEVPKIPYRQKHDLITVHGDRVNHSDYYYSELLCDASLFMLTTILRRLFADNLIDMVKDTRQWRSNMTIYEHRSKGSG